jgi:ribosomal protein S6
MKLYELYIIINPNLKEEDVNGLSAQITSELDKNGFGVTSSQIKQKERLTYGMSHFRQAHVLDMEISGPDEKSFPEELDRNLLHNENVLRHFVYAKSEKNAGKAKPFPNFDQIRTSRTERRSSPVGEVLTPAEPKQETQKVDIEEVDKKLEELLK